MIQSMEIYAAFLCIGCIYTVFRHPLKFSFISLWKMLKIFTKFSGNV